MTAGQQQGEGRATSMATDTIGNITSTGWLVDLRSDPIDKAKTTGRPGESTALPATCFCTISLVI
jgi:hypothetical protein